MNNVELRKKLNILATLLIFVLVLADCTTKDTKVESFSEKTSKLEEIDRIEESELDLGIFTEDKMSMEAKNSINMLRLEMNGTHKLFACAYIGYLEENYNKDDHWLDKLNSEILKEYPFIKEIPKDLVMGRTGELYCILPRDKKVKFSINKIGKSDKCEALYRSDGGSPIMIFCNMDEDDKVEISLINDKEETVIWKPMRDSDGFICLAESENGDILCRDFSIYPQEGVRYEDLIQNAWKPPTIEELGKTMWTTWNYPQIDKRVNYFLNLHIGKKGDFGEYVGEASFSLKYDGNEEAIENYEGWWRLEKVEGKICLRLDLQCNGGTLYKGEGKSKRISDVFPILLDKKKENIALGKGVKNKTILPFQSDQLDIEFLVRTFG